MTPEEQATHDAAVARGYAADEIAGLALDEDRIGNICRSYEHATRAGLRAALRAIADGLERSPNSD